MVHARVLRVVALALCVSACSGDDDASGTAGSGATGAGGAAGAGGAGGSAGTGGAAGSGEISGCDGASLLAKPDYGDHGPWPVGARSIEIARDDGRTLRTEIWYPATPGSEDGETAEIYDIRDNMPAEQAAKVPDADNPWQPCDCWRDLPLDVEHGPYPMIVFVHGTAGFFGQNLDNAVHWASRGFVVMAANHPGLYIGDMVSFQVAGRDLAGDVKLEIDAMSAHQGDLASFDGHVDLTRLAASGHSAGGAAVAPLGDLPGMKVLIPISGGDAPSGANLESALVIAGIIDQTWGGAQSAYEGSAAAPKRLLGVTGIAHAGVTSLCEITNADGQDIVAVAEEHGVMSPALAGLAAALFDCAKDTEPESKATAVIDFTTAAVLEETLHCDDQAAAALADTSSRYPIAGDWRETP